MLAYLSTIDVQSNHQRHTRDVQLDDHRFNDRIIMLRTCMRVLIKVLADHNACFSLHSTSAQHLSQHPSFNHRLVKHLLLAVQIEDMPGVAILIDDNTHPLTLPATDQQLRGVEASLLQRHM